MFQNNSEKRKGNFILLIIGTKQFCILCQCLIIVGCHSSRNKIKTLANKNLKSTLALERWETTEQFIKIASPLSTYVENSLSQKITERSYKIFAIVLQIIA